jgi:hypothetical protein
VAHDQTGVKKGVEWAANPGGAHPQRLPEVSGRGGPGLQEGTRHPLSGLSGEFHYIIVA